MAMLRTDCLRLLASLAESTDSLAVVALGSMIDEWHALRPSEKNFFNSAMGSNLPLAMGLAFALPRRTVMLLDTDGSQLMTLGALATLANHPPDNLRVFVMDNESYAYTGGQPTATAGRTDLARVASAAGVEGVYSTGQLSEFRAIADAAVNGPSLAYVVAKVEGRTGTWLPRGFTRAESKYRFVRYIESAEGRRILPKR